MKGTWRGKSREILPAFAKWEQPHIPAGVLAAEPVWACLLSAACMGHMVRYISWNLWARLWIYVVQTLIAQCFPEFRAVFSNAPPMGYLWIESQQWRQLFKVKSLAVVQHLKRESLKQNSSRIPKVSLQIYISITESRRKFFVYYVKDTRSFRQWAIDTKQNTLICFASYSLNFFAWKTS